MHLTPKGLAAGFMRHNGTMQEKISDGRTKSNAATERYFPAFKRQEGHPAVAAPENKKISAGKQGCAKKLI